MTKKKAFIPPEVIRTFKDFQSLYPAGYVEKLGANNGLTYYQFVIPDGEDGPIPTGYPLICSWDGQDAKDVYGIDALRIQCRFV